MKTIYCVTGATGHLGNNVVKQLVECGHTVRALVLPNQPTNMLDNSVQIFYGDTCQYDTLVHFMQHDSDQRLVVIHMAAIVSITKKYDKRVYDVNVNGTKNVVDCAIANNADKLIHVSSVHAIATKRKVITYDCDSFNPKKVVGNYAKSKAIATQYVLDKAREGLINATVLLPTGIIGVRDYAHNHLVQMLQSYIEGKLPIAVKGGYDFVDVIDVANAVRSAVEYGRSGQCYIISNKHYTIKQLLDMASNALGIKRVRNYIAVGFARMFAPLCELHYKRKKATPLFTDYSLSVLQSGDKFSHEKATRELFYYPTSMECTIRNTALWLVDEKGVKIGKNMLMNPQKVLARLKRAKAKAR